MMLGTFLAWVGLASAVAAGGRTGSAVVAASNSSLEAKARADYICDGVDDRLELLESFTCAEKFPVRVNQSPMSQKEIECYGRHLVQWLPGDYDLGGTLTLPNAADVAIEAEGAFLHNAQTEGDAIVITGMTRCRYRFGTVRSRSTGAAIRVRPDGSMPALFSIVSFTGLIGSGRVGTGLLLDTSVSNVCTDRFEGTDISGFDKGVCVTNPSDVDPWSGRVGKCDTNWLWFQSVRTCNTCISEGLRGTDGVEPAAGGALAGIDDNVWNVSVDASVTASVGVRIGGRYGRWNITMGTWSHEGVTRALILDQGALHNVIEVHPPLQDVEWEDRSGNDTNVVWTTERPPLRSVV